MKQEKPIFLGSWKGRVIKAIALNGAQSWYELRDFTGLSPKSLNRTLAELMSAKALEKHTQKDENTITMFQQTCSVFYEKKEERKKDIINGEQLDN